MKPKKLYIQAFGSFAKAQEIDFEKLGNNLYLVAGETAAGKTTIFDALCFALYGVASGSERRALSAIELHSDYCKHADTGVKDPMEVRLEFSHGGNNYIVTRKLDWGVSGKNKNENSSSQLQENEETIFTSRYTFDNSNNEVTNKIKSIIALDVNQFSQIVMLAQGEFSNFLKAETKEREVILARLCDNSLYQDFETRLKALNKRLGDEISKNAEKAKECLKEIVELEQPQTEAERQQFNIYNELLLGIIGSLIKKLDIASEENEQEQVRLKEIREQLIVDKTKAEGDNKNLDALDKQKETQKSLDNQKTNMLFLQQAVDKAEKALKVFPSEAALKQKKTDLKADETDKENLEEEIEQKNNKIFELKAVEVKSKQQQGLINQLAVRISILEQGLNKYVDLEKALAALTEKKNICDSLASKYDALDVKISVNTKALESCMQVLEGLKQAGESEVDNKQHALGDIQKELAETEELQKNIAVAISKEQLYDALEKDYLAKYQATTIKKGEYDQLYTAFLKGQAGYLADKLKSLLQEQEEVTCPVCNTVHKRGAEVHFATSDGAVPTKDRVDESEAAWKNEDKELRQALEKRNTAKLVFEGLVEKLVSDFEKLFKGGLEWDALKSIGLSRVKELTTTLENRKSFAEAALKQAKKNKTLRESKEKEQSSLFDKQKQLGEEKIKLQNEQKKAAEEMDAAKELVSQYKGSMQALPATKAAANAELRSKKLTKERLENAIKQAEAEVRTAEKELENLKGSLVTKLNRIEIEKTEVEHCEDKLAEELRKYGFDNFTVYISAMAPEGIQLSKDKLEHFIDTKHKLIENYKKDCILCRQELERLQKATDGLVKKDVLAMQERIEAVAKNINGLVSGANELKSKAEVYKRNLKKLAVYAQERAKLSNAKIGVNKLTSSVDGNLKFRVFVLARYFKNILRFANKHLQKMTQGRYCLRHIEGADKRKLSGLEFDIFDITTNQSRSLKKLSGGEKFEVALSLALGLSDVVQSSSSRAIEISSMFIDEGFGNLGDKDVDRAIDVLQKLSSGNRQIGIISHVARLEECIPIKLQVERDEKLGSFIVEKIDG